MNKNLRDPETFQDRQTVYLQDQDGRWTIKAVVVSRRQHQGMDTASYLLRKVKTKCMTVRNARSIRRFEGDSSDTDVDTMGSSVEDTSRTGNNSTMNINLMKTPLHPSLMSSLPKNSNSIHAYRLSTVPSPGRTTK